MPAAAGAAPLRASPDDALVEEAIRATQAPGIDVSSGVESAPGVKDIALIKTFLARARAASKPLGSPLKSA